MPLLPLLLQLLNADEKLASTVDGGSLLFDRNIDCFCA
jgi:hypothetical protein